MEEEREKEKKKENSTELQKPSIQAESERMVKKYSLQMGSKRKLE